MPANNEYNVSEKMLGYSHWKSTKTKDAQIIVSSIFQMTVDLIKLITTQRQEQSGISVNKLIKLETIFFAIVAKITESKILCNFRVTMDLYGHE